MRRSASAVFLAAALLAILWATLRPGAALESDALSHVRWQAFAGDLLRNLVLFVPLGAASAARGLRPRTALGGAIALSTLIELAQLAIPGRFTSPWDTLANTLGAGLGAALARDARRWLALSPAEARRRVLAAGVLAAGWLLLGAWLTAPSPPPGDYFAHWTPDLANFAPIDARLRAASLGGAPLPHGALADPAGLRRALGGDFELRLAGWAGRPTQGLGALFWITNRMQHEVLLVGVEGSDLILRWPGRGSPVALETAPLRVPGFFGALAAGAPFELTVDRRGAQTCAALGARRDCGLGLTAGDGWRVLAPDLRLEPRQRDLLAAVFLAALWLPIGFWFAPAPAPLAAVGAAAAATLLAPSLGALLPTPLAQWLAAALGFALGAGLRRLRISAAGAGR